MKSAIALTVLALALPVTAAAEATLDIGRCADTASKYGSNPFSLDMNELDVLRQCVNWQAAVLAREGENQRINRAIELNFGTRRTAALVSED